ncbi:Rrp12p like nucleolar protein [Cryptosporidium canis]|nr:Rrp12p like nucleolar protein [Cryptosporidium canis]
MDPLILDVEETLKSLSQKKESYLEAFQSFLIIKDSIISRHEFCTVPKFIELTFEAIDIILTEDKPGSVQAYKDQKTLNGLLILQKRLLGVLDMNVLGINYLAISQVIINRLVNTLIAISRYENTGVEIFHVTSTLKQFCSILDYVQLKPNVFTSLINTYLQNCLPEKQKIEIRVCIVSLLKMVQDNTSIMISIQNIALHYVSMIGQRQLDSSNDFALEHFEQILTPLNHLYFSLIELFEEHQIREYINSLLQLCILKRQKSYSVLVFECLANQVNLLKAIASEHEYIWIPIYTLENLTNKFKETKDTSAIQAYLTTCTNCFNYVLLNVTEDEVQKFNIQATLDTFIHSLRQFMFTPDSNIHSLVINFLTELVFNTKTDIKKHQELDKSAFKYTLFETMISKLIPFCLSILEDYRYKLSWSELLSLLIIIIESWDELTIINFYHSGTLESLKSRRSSGVELFETVISRSLNMASIALCGVPDYSLEYKDLSRMKEELRRIVGSITRAFGPNLVLKYMPLRFDDVELTDTHFSIKSNSWLLPLLRVHITRTYLSFFAEYFLPLAIKLNSYCSEYQETQPNYARLYSILEEQIWALLPGFFDEPLDLLEAFGGNQSELRVYMLQLMDKPGVRNHVCNALLRISRQTFIGRGLSDGKEDEYYDAKKMSNIDSRTYYVAMKTWENNTEALFIHSKTFLSLLIVKFLNCNSENTKEIHIEAKDEQESQLYLACIQNLVPFCDESILQANLKNFYTVWENLAQGVESSKLPFSCGKIIALLDVAIVMFKRISVDKVNTIISYFTRLLKVILIQDNKKHFNEKTKLLRRLYKGLRVGLETLRERSSSFSGMKDQMLNLWKILSLGSGKCPINSLKHRLGALRAFIQLLNKVEDRNFVLCFGNDQIINHLIPEILFSTREPNTTVRINSMALLKSLIECYIEDDKFLETIIVKIITLSQINTEQINNGYIEVSCIISLSRIIFDYGDLLQKNQMGMNSTLQLIINFIMHSLNSNNPLIYLNGLKSVKVCLFRLDTDVMWNYTPTIISNMLNNQFCALKFRMHVRRILISIIKKFGAEKALQAFPSQHAQLYRYLIRKINRSAKKKISRKNQDMFDNIMYEDYDESETKEASSNNYEEIVHAFEDEDDYSSDEEGSYRRKSPLDVTSANRSSQMGAITSRKQRNVGRSLTILDDSYSNTQDPIDLLSTEASSRILSSSTNKMASKRIHTSDGTVEFDKALNKIIVNEEVKPSNAELLDQNANSDYNSLPLTREGIKHFKKGLLSNRQDKRREKKSRKQHVTVKSAKEFKGKRAQGDIYKNGMQPFAYMRLNPALSKEKHKLSATKSLSTIFNKKGRN